MADAVPALFSGDALKKHIDEFAPKLGVDDQRVVVLYGKTDGTIRAGYIERFGRNLTAEIIAGHAPSEGWTGAARLVWTAKK